MAVMRSNSGKELYLDCSCGCDAGLKFKLGKFDENYLYITLSSGNYYKEQDLGVLRVIGLKLKKIWRIIRGRDYVYSELCLSREELSELTEYLTEMKDKAD